MLRLGDLQNRVYNGKTCVRFEYMLEISNRRTVNVMFNRLAEDTNLWKATILLDRTRDKDSELYNFMYALPKDNVPLELVAATGLKYFQLYIKEEVQMKSDLDFALGVITDGVVG